MLNPRQRAFVNAYASNGFKNGTEAAIEAGYSKRRARQTASRLVTNGDIKRAIEELRQPAKEEAIVDAAFVLQKLKEIVIVNSVLVPRESADGAQTLDKNGQFAWKMVDSAAANTALKTLSGCLGIDGKKEDKDSTIQALAETLQDVLKNGEK